MSSASSSIVGSVWMPAPRARSVDGISSQLERPASGVEQLQPEDRDRRSRHALRAGSTSRRTRSRQVAMKLDARWRSRELVARGRRGGSDHATRPWPHGHAPSRSSCLSPQQVCHLVSAPPCSNLLAPCVPQERPTVSIGPCAAYRRAVGREGDRYHLIGAETVRYRQTERRTRCSTNAKPPSSAPSWRNTSKPPSRWVPVTSRRR